MNLNEELKIEPFSIAKKFIVQAWIILLRVEVGEANDLQAGEAGVATIPQCVYTLTTLGQKHISEIKQFIVH